MRIGDKVYCIKNRENEFTFQIENEFIVDKDIFYTIIKITDNHIEISSNIAIHFRYRIIEDDTSLPYFDEYFITNKEYRKLKLKKIDGSRR